jgi:hypothetical protein
MKTLFAVMLCFSLAGCGATVGLGARTSVSTFDGSRSVSIEPHGTNCGMSMVCTLVGAEWNSKHPEQAFLIIEYMGSYTSIQAAALNVDGQIIPISPEKGESTQFSNPEEYSGNLGLTQLARTSDRYFPVPLALIERISSSKSVKLRVRISETTIDSVIIDGQKDSKAFYALQRFLKEIAQVKGQAEG